MQLTQSYWENYLSEIGLPELPLQEVNLIPYDKDEVNILYSNMDSVFGEFLKFCERKHMKELVQTSFKSIDLDAMAKGNCPHNASIMLKIPLEYGGDIDPSNMYIVQKNPFQFIIMQFQMLQIKEFNKEISNHTEDIILPETLYVPYPPGMVFVPALGTLAGGGGISHGGKSNELGAQTEQNKIQDAKEKKEILLAAAMNAASAKKKGK
ncbi:MAG: hypothetical protein LBU68_00465 [Rickettsiales bacterium]|jgi:hypothetical protein|nr:hypothetical protein [Rickettsiales bacterium]